MYDPKFTQKEMYDQYGSSRKTTNTSKPNANKTFADSMKAGGGGRNMSGIGAKPPSFGGGQDNNPNRDEYENKSTIDKVKEKAVDLFKSFGAKEPEALIVDGKRVYQGPLFSGFDPTVRVGEFGLDNNPNRDASPAMPYGTVNMFGVNTDNPRLNMFGVERGAFRDPSQLIPPVLPETPVNMDPMTRVLSQAMLPTEVNYTIQDGDTLSEIARDAGTTVQELKELNNIDDIDVIDAGANLKVPVKAGKLTDTQAALRRGLDRDKDNEGVQTAMSIVPSSILSDASAVVDTSLRPQMRPTDSSSLPDGEYFSAEHMSDLEILARTIEAEAGSESKKGKLAVGATIKNRVDKQSWMGKDIKSVILKKGQFSPWNSYTNYAGGEQGQAMLTSAKKPSKDSYEAAKKILDGKYKDPTGGATHFVNPKVGTKPSWYKKFKKNTVEKIGRHEFGSPDDPTWDLQSSLRPKVRPKGLGAK